MFVSFECFVLSCRGLCDGPILCPEDSYRLWCVSVYDLENSSMRPPCPTWGCCARNKLLVWLYFTLFLNKRGARNKSALMMCVCVCVYTSKLLWVI
jgi:hypothetical protein